MRELNYNEESAKDWIQLPFAGRPVAIVIKKRRLREDKEDESYNMKKVWDFLFGGKCTVCNKTRTNRIRKADGKHVCFDCQLAERIANEPRYNCPKCTTLMNKQYLEKTIIDKCPECGGVFLDHKELYGVLHQTSIHGA